MKILSQDLKRLPMIYPLKMLPMNQERKQSKELKNRLMIYPLKILQVLKILTKKSVADDVDELTVFAPQKGKDEDIITGFEEAADDLSFEDIAGLEDSEKKSIADDVAELTVFAPQKDNDEDIITGFEEAADDLSLENIAELEDSEKKSVADDIAELTVFAPQKGEDEDIITGFEVAADDNPAIDYKSLKPNEACKESQMPDETVIAPKRADRLIGLTEYDDKSSVCKEEPCTP